MADNDTGTRAHRAGLFDIRFIIAALMGTYGVILIIVGLVGSDSKIAQADGFNVNIVGGVGMALVAIAFAVWARVRPIVVPDQVQKDHGPPAAH